MKKINAKAVKTAIKTGIALVATWQIGEVLGSYKTLKRINECGIEDDRVKRGLDAQRNIEEGIEKIKSSVIPKPVCRYDDDPDEFEDDDLFCEATEEANDVVEEATDNQPED